MDFEHLRDKIERCIETFGETQERIIALANEPAQQKTLRLFPTSEAADLIGISEGHLRALTQDGGDFEGGTLIGAGGRRAFTLEEINAIRQALLDRTGDERYRRHRNMSERLQVLAVANFKGGASKTTTSAHLGQFLAMRGYRVLLIDCDSQGSLTGIFGLVPDVEIQGEHTLLPVFEGTTSTLDGLIRKTYWPGLDLVPASLGLYQSEFLLPVRQLRDRSLRFWTILADAIQSVADAYDVVVCDCPPSLGYLSINAVCAATSVLVPVPPSMLDYSSTGAFLQMIIEVFEKARRSNPNLGNFDFFKLMVARFKSDDRNQQEVVKALRKTAGELLLNRAMALTTGIDAAGNRKQTFYEIKASEFPGTRKTYLRALQQLNLLNYEIENLLLQVWGRAPVLDDQTSIAAQ